MKMKSIIRCVNCNENYDVWVDPADLAAWSEGELIQDVLDYLTPGERELLMSGTCDACWDKLFPPDETDEGETNE